MNGMTDLRPCPFCGEKVSYNFNADFEPDGIVCANCHIIVRFMRIKVGDDRFEKAMDEMADVWNERFGDRW